jgi:hypothetical protein
LCRVTVDEKTAEHGVAQASNFVLNKKNAPIVIRVDDFFKAKLMIPHLFRNQATLL